MTKSRPDLAALKATAEKAIETNCPVWSDPHEYLALCETLERYEAALKEVDRLQSTESLGAPSAEIDYSRRLDAIEEIARRALAGEK